MFGEFLAKKKSNTFYVKLLWLRFVYITTKTRRFRVSIGHLTSNENFFRYIKLASLMQKCRVFIIM